MVLAYGQATIAQLSERMQQIRYVVLTKTQIFFEVLAISHKFPVDSLGQNTDKLIWVIDISNFPKNIDAFVFLYIADCL